MHSKVNNKGACKLSTEIIPSEACRDKDIRMVDPLNCKMWDRHNRVYKDLTEKNCRSLISALLEQGCQEFSAIVRLSKDPNYEFEVICGARRHWSVTYLREKGYSDFMFQIEVRELNDAEAFMLGHIENNERKDISDYERAVDFLHALNHYYKSQKVMALALGVKEAWLSRYLDLARLPKEAVRAFPSKSSILPGHAKMLKSLLKTDKSKKEVIVRAKTIIKEGASLSAAEVVKALMGTQNTVPECALTLISRPNQQILVKVIPEKLIVHIPTDKRYKNKMEVAEAINDFFKIKIVN